MLKLRLQRIGRKNDPHFRLVVINSTRAPKSGGFVEQIGFYNPKSGEIKIDKERAKYWLTVGAKPSATVFNFFVDQGLLTGPKIHVARSKSKKEKTPAT